MRTHASRRGNCAHRAVFGEALVQADGSRSPPNASRHFAGKLEVAPLQVRAGHAAEFEAAFIEAQRIIAAKPGYLSHELQRCLERPNEYVLLVRWESLEAHEVGFRKSAEYQDWKRLLHHFYEPFPVVSHYEVVQGASSA